MWLAFLWGCAASAPKDGVLQTDVAGLAARTQLPEGTEEVRWMIQAAHMGREGTGRADGRIFAWVTTPGDVTEWLTATLGEALGPRASWIHDDIADVLFTDVERGQLQRNAARKTWKLGCVRYPAARLGRGEYRGELVLDCAGHLYLALSAH